MLVDIFCLFSPIHYISLISKLFTKCLANVSNLLQLEVIYESYPELVYFHYFEFLQVENFQYSHLSSLKSNHRQCAV